MVSYARLAVVERLRRNLQVSKPFNFGLKEKLRGFVSG